jgi:hypothetical protein
MQAVRAIYKQGHIELLAPLQDVTEAELFVIVLDKAEQTGDVLRSFRPIEANSEQEFKTIGLSSFFDTNEDNNVDWEDMFDAKRR